MEDCIFCKIAKGEIDSAKIYEDDDVFVFLDVNPITKGHCLVIPKQHFENVFDISKEALGEVAIVGQQIAGRIKNNLGAAGVNLLQSNGQKAGQVIFHFHLHVIPRYENDRLEIRPVWVTKDEALNYDINSLKELAEKINS